MTDRRPLALVSGAPTELAYTDALRIGNLFVGGASGAESLQVPAVASAVNSIQIRGAVTTGAVEINATGTDAFVGIAINPKTPNGNPNATGFAIVTGGMQLRLGGRAGPQATSGSACALMIGADNDATTITTNTSKRGVVNAWPYDITQLPVGVISATMSSTTSNILIGGGATTYQAATSILFYTASATNVTAGTQCAIFGTDQSLILGTVQTSDAVNKLQIYGSCAIKSGNLSLVLGADSGATTITNSTSKRGIIVCPHYTNANVALGMIAGFSNSGSSTVSIGGGTSVVNAATVVNIYTATSTNTTTGTLCTSWDANGNMATLAGTADQSYSRNVPTTGFSLTLGNNRKHTMLAPAGTLATGTITMPSTPIDGQEVIVSSTQIITALTVNANTGQSVMNAPTTIAAGGRFSYIYHLSSTTWYVG